MGFEGAACKEGARCQKAAFGQVTVRPLALGYSLILLF